MQSRVEEERQSKQSYLIKIISYNIISVGGRIKKQEVKDLVCRLHPVFVCIQESNYCDHATLNPCSIWEGAWMWGGWQKM